MTTPTTLISLSELHDVRNGWESEGAKVVFVPTMGALHEGHMQLVRVAQQHGSRVIVSIFVNPAQFGPNEDFAKYPRTLAADLELLANAGVDAVFLPNAMSMYPDGFQTYVINKSMAKGLCGAVRPGHFEGVLTVVLMLFNLVRPHTAIFGKKDYQQWRLIERMAQDLHLPVRVLGQDTVRESDGLAMSSRNRYLSSSDRRLAVKISKGIKAAKQMCLGGTKDVQALIQACKAELMAEPGITLEYLELRRQSDLSSFDETVLDAPGVMLVACRIGSTRLIDNMEMG
jgi:pantoate--beta-alanine ligase